LQIIWGVRNWNGLLIYLLNSDGVPDWSDGGTNPRVFGQIEKREIVLASVVLLVHPIVVLIMHLAFPDTLSGISPGFHGISQVVYDTPQLARIMVLALGVGR